MPYKYIENNIDLLYNEHVMRITKIFTPLEKAAMSLFKETTGNDLGKRYPYLTDGINQDIFVSGNKTKK